MTVKRNAYIQNRIDGLAPQAAALSAGYSRGGIEVTASNLEKREDVRKGIAKGKRMQSARTKRADPDDSKAETSPELQARDSYLHDSYETPLDLFKHLMNETRAPTGVRIEAAKIALPFVNGKVADSGKAGKKKQLELDAKAAAVTGKFRPRSAPNRSHVN